MIHDTPIPELPALAARRLLRLGKYLFPWRLFSWQSLVGSIVISWVVTSGTYLLGALIDGDPWRQLPSELPLALVYLANFPCDAITIFVTIRIVQRLARSPGFLTSTSLIAVTLLVAGVLAVLSYVLLFCANDVSIKYNLPEARRAEDQGKNLRQHDIEKAIGPGYAEIKDVPKSM
jgi:hypothetical protein